MKPEARVSIPPFLCFLCLFAAPLVLITAMPPPRVTVANLHADLAAGVAHFRSDVSAVERARARVEAALADGHAHYGINTGFGALARERVPDDQLARLQRNLLLSHAVGVGDPVPPEITRVMLRLKIHALGLGYSGVSVPTFRRLLEFDERDLIPVVPSRGSVGASGDLAPLAHLCLPLIGHGEFWPETAQAGMPVPPEEGGGGTGIPACARPALEALRAHNLAPLELGAKD